MNNAYLHTLVLVLAFLLHMLCGQVIFHQVQKVHIKGKLLLTSLKTSKIKPNHLSSSYRVHTHGKTHLQFTFLLLMGTYLSN